MTVPCLENFWIPAEMRVWKKMPQLEGFRRRYADTFGGILSSQSSWRARHDEFEH
jgi:hypothetical protein